MNIDDKIFLDYLKTTFGENKPIFISEVKYQDKPKSWIQRKFNILNKHGVLLRHSRGIYYLPIETELGKSLLNPKKIIIKKYIKSNEDIFGFFSRNTLLNNIGVSNQVPFVYEICTNRTSVKKKISIDWQRVILYPSPVEINNENVDILKLVDLLNFTNAEYYLEGYEKKNLIKYINNSGIRLQNIVDYTKFYSNNVYKTLIESGLIYSIPH